MAAERVRIYEVGPRDGLQNESRSVTYAQKIRFIEGLIQAGISDIEIGSFVRHDRVPQMADTNRIYSAIKKQQLNFGKARPWCLIPNRQGLNRAIEQGAAVKNVAAST